jgi:hypothetical protein
MARKIFLFASILLVAISGIAARSVGDTYTSYFIDDGGRLHLRLDSGKYVLAPRDKSQVKFDSPAISRDGMTVGWLNLYPFPRADKHDYDPGPIAEALTIYRNRHILHRFDTAQVIWDWHFWRDGSEVAYSVGPTHGGASGAFLCDVATGKVLAHWLSSDTSVPDWAKDFRD